MHSKSNVLLARQPIFDQKLNTIGYELLYRPIPSDEGNWQEHSGNLATNEVLVSAFDNIGIENVTAGKPAYINFTEHWLHNPPPFNPNQVVIEILEHIPATPQNLAAVIKLRQRGFTIALDDYVGSREQDPLLPYVDIIKLDILGFSDLSEVKRIITCKGKDNFLWLAEKVETQDVYRTCLEAGCDYFQGYFFSRPANIYGKKISSNKSIVLDLIVALQNPEITIAQLEDLLSQDPALSFRLLKLVNSAAFSQINKVDSLQKAIMVAGVEQIKTWVTMISLSKLKNKPKELSKQSLQRAYFCKHLARAIPGIACDIAFTAGLLSNLDAFFDKPIDQLLAKIHLQQDISTALTKRSGKLGFIFTTVLYMEKGEWHEIRWQLWQKTGLNAHQIEGFYLDSIQEAETLLDSNLR